MPDLEIHQRNEFERLKRELEVDDDEIRAFSSLKSRFQRMMLRFTGSDRDHKMLQLGQILKNRQECSQVLGNNKKTTPIQADKDKNQPSAPAEEKSPLNPEDPHARFDFVEFGRDFRIDSATFESLERICGKDFCKWRLAKVFIKALKSSYCISEHMHAFEKMIENYCFAPTFEMNARWLQIYARRAFAGKQNDFFVTLEKAKKMAKGDADKFNLYLNIMDFSPETLMAFLEVQALGYWNEGKMAVMAGYGAGLTAEKMKTIFKCHLVYGQDDRIFKTVADYVVANVKIYPDKMVEGLLASRIDWTFHPERFKAYMQLAQDGLTDVIMELLNVSEMTRGHSERFERLATLGRIGKRGRIIVAIAEHRKLFEQDDRMFQMLCEVGAREKENGTSNIHELARAKRICANNPELFEICHNLIKKGNRIGAGLLLSNRDLFEGMPERLPVLLKILESSMAIQYLNEIKEAKSFYAEKKERFLLVANLLLNGGMGKVRLFIESAKRLRADDEMVRLLADLFQYQVSEMLLANLKKLKNLKVTNGLLKEVNEVCGLASKKDKQAPMMVPYLNCLDIYANEPKGLEEVRRLPNEVPNMLLAMEILNHFQTNNRILAKKTHRMRIMTELGKEGKDEAVKALKIAVGIYGDDDDLFDFFLKTSELRGYEMVQKLCNSEKICGKKSENYRIATEFYDLGLEHGDKILATFISKYKEFGKAKAIEYISELQEQAKTLIGPEIPKAARRGDHHRYLVSLVFPPGHYSDYDRNLSCGDRLEHLAPYKFNRDGYPTEMTGVTGYVLREGEADNQELLKSYVDRLGNMRNFIQSRGPNNEALQEAYEAKIDRLCQENLREEFKQIKEMTVKEKLLCLFTGEIMKKHAQKNYKAVPEIFDLVVEYKYAYQDNLEAYVQRSADTTRRMRDPESQRYNLWYELSNIYGENLKHVIRHDLLADEVLTGENYALIEKTYAKILGEKVEQDLKPKQKANFMNVFTNEHIPEEGYFDPKKNKQVQGRYETLVKQAVTFFSANVKFVNDEDREAYRTEAVSLMEGCKGKDLFKPEVFFEQIVPKLFALKNQKVLNLKAKLEELFSADSNKISAEVARFDEEVEVEAKETRIGGDKHKKVEKKAKRRKIRGFFTKTTETANARMGAYLCIAGDVGMWKNPEYFELVLKDEETGKCVGLVMLLNIAVPGNPVRGRYSAYGKEPNKKYLWFGPNPYESFLGQVSSSQCYRYMYETVTRFAEENGYDGVVVPAQEGMILGMCTNRGGDFPELIKQSRIRDKGGKIKVADFGKQHTLSGYYGYRDGALIWEKPKKVARQEDKRLPPPLHRQ